MKRLSRLALLLVLAAVLGGSAPAPRPAADPQSGAVGDEELETFVPSERLPADSAVAFPVDI